MQWSPRPLTTNRTVRLYLYSPKATKSTTLVSMCFCACVHKKGGGVTLDRKYIAASLKSGFSETGVEPAGFARLVNLCAGTQLFA